MAHNDTPLLELVAVGGTLPDGFMALKAAKKLGQLEKTITASHEVLEAAFGFNEPAPGLEDLPYFEERGRIKLMEAAHRQARSAKAQSDKINSENTRRAGVETLALTLVVAASPMYWEKEFEKIPTLKAQVDPALFESWQEYCSKVLNIAGLKLGGVEVQLSVGYTSHNTLLVTASDFMQTRNRKFSIPPAGLHPTIAAYNTYTSLLSNNKNLPASELVRVANEIVGTPEWMPAVATYKEPKPARVQKNSQENKNCAGNRREGSGR